MPGAMAVALLVMGCMFMLAFWWDFRATQRYGLYVKTNGVLKKSWVETSTTEERRPHYTPHATYEYVVAGKKFTGQTITPPSDQSSARPKPMSCWLSLPRKPS
jgi:hypothetical protein